jgi:hypothetical protein
MPHLKCEACKVRLRRAGEPTGLADACPLCGRPLQSARDLSQLVGFRWVDARLEEPRDGISMEGHQRLAAGVAEVMARRRAVARRSRQHPERWAP